MSSPDPRALQIAEARLVLVNTVSGYTGLMAAAGPKELPQVIALIDKLIAAALTPAEGPVCGVTCLPEIGNLRCDLPQHHGGFHHWTRPVAAEPPDDPYIPLCLSCGRRKAACDGC